MREIGAHATRYLCMRHMLPGILVRDEVGKRLQGLSSKHPHCVRKSCTESLQLPSHKNARPVQQKLDPPSRLNLPRTLRIQYPQVRCPHQTTNPSLPSGMSELPLEPLHQSPQRTFIGLQMVRPASRPLRRMRQAPCSYSFRETEMRDAHRCG